VLWLVQAAIFRAARRDRKCAPLCASARVVAATMPRAGSTQRRITFSVLDAQTNQINGAATPLIPPT